MFSMNSVTLIGRVGKSPEIKEFSNGGSIANFSMATEESWKDKDGERQTKTEWTNISVRNKGLIGIVDKFVKKGSKVAIQGKLQTRKWEDKEGNDRYTTEVVLGPYNSSLVLLDSKNGRSDDDDEDYNQDKPSENPSHDLNDQIPF